MRKTPKKRGHGAKLTHISEILNFFFTVLAFEILHKCKSPSALDSARGVTELVLLLLSVSISLGGAKVQSTPRGIDPS